MTAITVHTDGACKGNPGPGAWGLVIEDEAKRLCKAGRVDHTTNQKMELTAAIKALESLGAHQGRPIQLFTDSDYLVKGMTEWMRNWKAKGWRGSNKKIVQNKELWQRLDELNQKHNVQWAWVKGHSGNPGNELADTLANRAMTEGRIVERTVLPL
jgi:ribonuclease HI